MPVGSVKHNHLKRRPATAAPGGPALGISAGYVSQLPLSKNLSLALSLQTGQQWGPCQSRGGPFRSVNRPSP